jgi:probable HAF family extracellular repeat protein
MLLSVIGITLFSIPTVHSQSYTIVDLGTLGGHASGSDGLNEAGETVGWAIAGSGGYYGFISTPVGPPLTNLGSPPNGSYSYAQSVNDSRQVVGYADVNVGFGTEDRAFFWEDGVMIDMGTLGGDASQARAINNSGQAVGWAEDGGPGIHAFIWEDGVMTELPGFDLGYPDSEARGINDAGISVGHSWDDNSVRQAVLWENGVMSKVFELIPGAAGAKAFAINNLNQSVGNVWLPGNETRAILWDEKGRATELPRTASHRYNLAHDINDRGQIVGKSYSGGHSSGSSGGPVLWEDGIVFELNDIVMPEPGKSLYDAYQINESGQIAATGNASGGFRAFRLDPIPNGLGLTGPDPGYTNQENFLAVRGGTPGERIYFVLGLVEGSSNFPGCPGLSFDIQDARLIGSSIVDEKGHAVMSGTAPPPLSGLTVLFQALEPSSCRISNLTTRYFL